MKRTFSTDRELRALKPSDRWYDVRDEKARNLIVRVGPENGKGEFRRTFCMVTRFPGSPNPARHAFGEYRMHDRGDLTLEQARALADEWRGLIRKNIDPREAEEARERRSQPQARPVLRRRGRGIPEPACKGAAQIGSGGARNPQAS